MSPKPQLSPDNILRFLQLRPEPVALEELSRSLHLKKNHRRPLLAMLAKLKKRGLIEELSHGGGVGEKRVCRRQRVNQNGRQ